MIRNINASSNRKLKNHRKKTRIFMKPRNTVILKNRRSSHGGKIWNKKLKDYKELHISLIEDGVITKHEWEYKGIPEWVKVNKVYVPLVEWEPSVGDFDSFLTEHKKMLCKNHPLYGSLSEEEAMVRIMNDYAVYLEAFSSLTKCHDSELLDDFVESYKEEQEKTGADEIAGLIAEKNDFGKKKTKKGSKKH